jgi:hypothetical protein
MHAGQQDRELDPGSPSERLPDRHKDAYIGAAG